jgi:hypothetical protein
MFPPFTYSHFIYTRLLESLTSFTSWHTTVTLGLSLLATSTGESIGFPISRAFRRARLFVVAHRCCGPRSRRAREIVWRWKTISDFMGSRIWGLASEGTMMVSMYKEDVDRPATSPNPLPDLVADTCVCT